MPRQRSILSQLLLCAIASVLTCGILSAEVPETLTLTDNSSNDFIVRNVNGHRVAISNHRLVSFADGKVTFRWRDSAHHNEQKLLTLSLDEFLRRFLLHLLPKGFMRIRNFGFLANRRRTVSLPLCFQLLPSRSAPQTGQDSSAANGAKDLWCCPQCAGPMVVIERLTPAEIQLRSPPLPVTVAA